MEIPVEMKQLGEIVRCGLRRGVCGVALWAALFGMPCLAAQDVPVTPAAPVPVPILAGKKVFVSNAGSDGNPLAVFKRLGDENLPYNQFHAAMKSWGRYELVGDPAAADLVFEIRFIAPLTSTQSVDNYAPQLDLSIFDRRTHFLLWRITQPVEGAVRGKTWDKNFNSGMADLLSAIKKLAAPSASALAER
jgi:hypothetical protein